MVDTGSSEEDLAWSAGVADIPPNREREAEPASILTAEELIERISLIQLNESTCFDHVTHEVARLQDIRDLCIDRRLVKDWQSDVRRKVVSKESVGFDPSESDPRITCNLWSGMPIKPEKGNCDALLGILEFLCDCENKSREVYKWILKWLAYPLQNPGAKMQTALAFHGPEGAGKNIFFGAIAEIYGRYAVSFNQDAIEDRFNDIFSARLFAVGNEVVSRTEFYHLPGRLKNMITESVWTVNPKNRPRRIERNCCNFVFFSNRPDILKLDADDRRFCVIWTPEPQGSDFYAEAAKDLRHGGAAALYEFLLNIDLGSFDEHSKPPLTQAKTALIKLTKDSPERFFDAWEGGELGELDVPYVPCATGDLFYIYRRWCNTEGERWPVPHNKFSAILKASCPVNIAQKKLGEKNVRVVMPNGIEPPMGPYAGLNAWLKKRVAEFHYAMKEINE